MDLHPKCLFFSILLFWSGGAFSQHDLSEERMEDLQELKEELKGTYQIQMVGTRGRPSVPMEAFEKIRDRRKEQEVSYYSIDEKTRVKILPKERIQREDFEGVEERIVHINKGE